MKIVLKLLQASSVTFYSSYHYRGTVNHSGTGITSRVIQRICEQRLRVTYCLVFLNFVFEIEFSVPKTPETLTQTFK